MKIVLLYHYFHPDDVVSARLFSDLAQGLQARGWDVEARPCNRGCRDETVTYPRRESWAGIDIRRVWRPAWRQSSTMGRVLNAIWMVAAWSGIALRRRGRRPDVVLLGSDPSLSILAAGILRRLRPSLKIVCWCHDLYPDAFFAGGILTREGGWGRWLRRRMQQAYRACDLVVDLGGCMRRRMDAYGLTGRRVTLTPWALLEPADCSAPDPAVRRRLFGDAKLCLLYSGNVGRAHTHADILALARTMRNDPVMFCFAVRGNRIEELRRAIGPEDVNIRLAPFASEAELETHLAAADIHLVSLHPDWSGVVVPSKFFGALAVGRPVLFAGVQDSCLAGWIAKHRVGWILNRNSAAQVAEALRQMASSETALLALQRHCHYVYQTHYSRCQVVAGWVQELGALASKSA